MWKLPLLNHWAIPSRNDNDGVKRRAKFQHVVEEHWGEEYWQKRKQMRAYLVGRANVELGGSYDQTGAYLGDAHMEDMYQEY